MNLPGPTRVFELTYLAEFHGVGKMTAYALLSAELFVIIRDGSYLLPNAVWNPSLFYDQIFKKMTWTITVYVAFGSIILGTTSVSGYWTSVPRPILWGPCLDSEAVDHWPPEMTISCGLSRSRRAGRIVSRSWRIRNRWGACIHVHACAIYIVWIILDCL